MDEIYDFGRNPRLSFSRDLRMTTGDLDRGDPD